MCYYTYEDMVEHIKEARLAGDGSKIITLSTLRAEIESKSVNDVGRQVAPSNEQTVAVVKKFIANAKYIMSVAPQDDPRYAQAKYELELYEMYVPGIASEQQIRDVVTAYLVVQPDAGFGQCMGHLKKTLGVQFDSNTSARVIQVMFASR